MKRPQFRNHGIDSKTLLGLVENTAPFLFQEKYPIDQKTLRYVSVLNQAKHEPISDSDLWSYFELCIASHFATVGTFVPTDVDLAIRSKLWAPVQGEKNFAPMWEQVKAFHVWDETLVSKRFVKTNSGLKLSGHQGEWFTIAMGAYACAKKSVPELLGEVRESIEKEVKNQDLALTELRETFLEDPNPINAKNYYAGVAAVIHNLGDLDRMFDLAEIEETDVLKRRVFRLGHEDARSPKIIFLEAGRIYQALLANENHRHFALREPKCLRIDSQFLLPFGPFMDDWGKGLVVEGLNSGKWSEGDLRSVVEALILGWKKLNANSIYHSQGYARALRGVAEGLGGTQGFKRGQQELENLVPPILQKELKQGGLRTVIAISQSEFEKKWVTKLRVELSKTNTDQI